MTPLSKRLSIALAVSVTVNLLLGGIMVGRAFQEKPHRAKREVPELRPEREDRRGALRDVYREHGNEFKESRLAIADARKAARAALETEPFERAALESALAQLRKETVESQEIMHRSILDAAEKGSPEKRKELANALERGAAARERKSGRPPKHE
jgi:uncharacterized membrane protein